jgi:hypothetical protein
VKERSFLRKSLNANNFIPFRRVADGEKKEEERSSGNHQKLQINVIF